MKTSICITVFNEEENIERLLDSLVNQTKKADEIIIVDSKSTDNTPKIIKKYQKKYKHINLISKKSSRSKGRNIAIANARNNIIAITDAGCMAKKDWLQNITKPFKDKKTDVVAGFYEMSTDNSFQEAESVFLGVLPSEFDNKYLPSARSMAFSKDIWTSVGGFPEEINDTAEDTVFNNKILTKKAKLIRAQKALVIWYLPNTVSEFAKKMCLYAKGDAQSKVFFSKHKKFTTHNLKVLTVFFRYIFLFIIFKYSNVLALLAFAIYLSWAFNKVYSHYNNLYSGLWGSVLQLVSDASVMVGFLVGMLNERKQITNRLS